MKTKYAFSILLFILLIVSRSHSDGFLKASGKFIVDGQNKQIQLRGMGLGGWLLPEGYMVLTSGFADAFWQMKNKINETVGAANADTFWTAYRKNFVTRKDIEQLSAWGFNSVRYVMHWEYFLNSNGTFREEGFIITDSLLQWCAENKIYLIFDLHAAPGGQSANNISDYNPAFLSFWESEANKFAAVKLWKELARRYKDEVWIGGYDLLNEPAWNLPNNNKDLRDIYVMITDSIRSVDKNHLLFIEGNWYATDFNGLAPAWDENMAWSFHKYWNGTDVGTINYLLTLRNETNRPLWMGESGENSNAWFAECIAMLEANNIGWSWWTYKKFETVVGPLSVPATPEYNALLKYWKGQASKPSAANAMKGLMGMAEGLKLGNCRFHPDVIDAMMRQPYSNSTKPFMPNSIPGIIYFTDYDLGSYNFAYKDIVYKNTDNATTWNNGGSYRNDGVDIQPCSDIQTNGYNVGWIETGEFLKFTVDVEKDGNYAVSVRVAANDNGGIIGLSVDNNAQILTTVTKTGGWQNWETQTLANVNLTQGTHTLRFSFYFGGFNVNYFESVYNGVISSVENNTAPVNDFSLFQNFPNPFNPATTITYSLPRTTSSGEREERMKATLTVYNILGKEIAVFVNKEQAAGLYTVSLNTGEWSGGVYFYTLQYGALRKTMRMLLVK